MTPEVRNPQAEPLTFIDWLWNILARRGALIAGSAAAVLALPGIALPFLADDWANLGTTMREIPIRTPFGYFRPLYLATYWLDQRLFGLSPAWFHVMNMAMIASCAFLVVVLIRRYTRNPALAGAAGMLFALHPWHVDNAAWIAGRSDPLFAVFFLLAALAYEHWRKRRRGLPVLSLLFFEFSLLSKEAAVALPPLLLLISCYDRSRRPDRRELLWGMLPFWVLAAIHFLAVRPLGLGGMGLSVLSGFGVWWFYKLFGFVTACVFPLPTEALEPHPIIWGGVAGLAISGLVLCVWVRRKEALALVLVSMSAFVILITPSLVSFQERFLFLPSAAWALALACLIASLPRRAATALVLVISAGWLGASGLHWARWYDAGRASSIFISGLVAASQRPGAAEIVVANSPHRVHGAPIAGDLSSALELAGGRRLPVVRMSELDYPRADADCLDISEGEAIRFPPPDAEVRMRVQRGLFARYLGPHPAPGETSFTSSAGAVFLGDDNGSVRVVIHPTTDGSRVAYVWQRGRLQPLF